MASALFTTSRQQSRIYRYAEKVTTRLSHKSHNVHWTTESHGGKEKLNNTGKKDLEKEIWRALEKNVESTEQDRAG